MNSYKPSNETTATARRERRSRTWPDRIRVAALGVAALAVLLAGPGVAAGAPLAGQPVATLSVPGSVFIGEDFSFTVTFDNASLTDPGFGPYIDLILPVTGTDGAGVAIDDGIDFASANYLGAPVTSTELVFPDPGGCVLHPYAVDLAGQPVTVCGMPGDKLVVLQLPFGSFTPDQPPAAISVNARLSQLADLGVPLTISANAGFRYGNDPLANPSTDPSLIGPTTSTAVTPKLIEITKTYVGPEDETATGPNFPRKWVVSVEIAPGQTLTVLDLTDLLPDNVAYLGVASIAPAGTPIDEPPAGVPSGPPDSTLVVRYATVTGAPSSPDATFTVNFFVPRLDAGALAVIDPVTGDDVLSTNQASALGSWTPIDTRDPGGVANAAAGPVEHDLTDKSIAIQKRVAIFADTGATGPTPGDVLEYTLDFQISDYFAFQSVVISDTFSDGQRWQASLGVPKLSVTEHGATSSGAMAGANYTVTLNSPGDGSTDVLFAVSDELTGRGFDGKLPGGCVPPAGTGGPPPDCDPLVFYEGGTTGELKFRTVIQEAFSDRYPSGDASVDQGDVLDNAVTIEGDLLDVADLAPNGESEADSSAAAVGIVSGNLVKSIYAVNGVACTPQPCTGVRIAAGDLLTYRLRYDMPSGDIEKLRLTDYLPLPVFYATEITLPFLTTVDAAPPSAGKARFGPADTFYALSGITPAITTAAVANSVKFDLGTYDSTDPSPRTIDLLFTVTASSDPFADGLFLTNQVRMQHGTTNSSDYILDAIVQVELTQPKLNLRKGVVAAYNEDGTPHGDAVFSPPAALPPGVAVSAPGVCSRVAGLVDSGSLSGAFDSNLRNVDQGDRVTYAIVVENTGGGLNGAYDITLHDVLPAGITTAAVSNLCVQNGAGAVLGYTGGVSDLFGGAGIELVDPANGSPPPATLGALGPGQDASGPILNGANIAIVTYDVVLPAGVEPLEDYENTASITAYAGSEGGGNFATAGDEFNGVLEDTAVTTIASPSAVKVISGTSQVHTSGLAVAVGEVLTYTVTVAVPEGVSGNVTVVDTLDAGLAFVDCLSVSAAPGLSTSLGSFAAACNDPANPAITNSGRTLTFTLGTVTNSNTENAVVDQVKLVYQAVVLNSSGNVRGVDLNNTATWAWDGGSTSASAPEVTIVEPTLQVEKTANPVAGDANDVVTFTLIVSHTPGSDAGAFNASLSDAIPSGMTYVAASLTHTLGLAPVTLSDSGGTITATWAAFPLGASSTLQFQAKIKKNAKPIEQIVNTAAIVWTSLPGSVLTPQSAYNALSTERTGNPGDPGGSANTYAASDTATVVVANVALAKSIVATSETFSGVVSGTERVAIGEIVRYRLTMTAPEASYADARLRDQLPAGLRFLNDGTASVAFVANGTGISSSTITTTLPGCAGLNITGASGSVTPTCPLPDTAVSSSATSNVDTYNSGTDPYFKLGDVLNGDDDGDSEYIVVEFNAVVENITDNQSATNRDNNFQALTGETVLATSSNVRVTVGEPVLTLAKSVTTAPTDAGDRVVYRLLVTNTASGDNALPAFDLVITDTLDAYLVPFDFSLVPPSDACAPGTSVGVLEQVVTGRVPCLNPGATASLTITATVAAAAPAGLEVPNQGDLTYTSLPDAGSCTNSTGSCAGTAGTATGERTGADGAGGVLNDYAAASSASVTLAAPSAAKLAPSPLQYTIGEAITYTIRVTLPEGLTQNLRVSDVLPAGLGYVSHTVISTAAASGGLLAADFSGVLNAAPVCPACTPGGSGGLVFTFGDTQTNGGGPVQGTSANQFLLRVVASVLNVSAPLNQQGSQLTNTAALVYDNPSLGPDQNVSAGSQTVTVLEPEITTTKAVNPTSGVEAGSTVTYTVTFLNSGNSTAYDVTAVDILAQGVAFSSLLDCTLQPDNTPVPSKATTSTGQVTFEGNPAGSWDIAVNKSIRCRYEATALSSLYVNGPHTNTVDADWSSLNGAAAGERIYDDTFVYNVDGAQDEATATFSVGAPVFTKTDGGVTMATIGDTLLYTLTIDSPLGTVRSLVVTDTLPAGLIYRSDQAVTGISTAPVFGLGGPNDGTQTVPLTWTFGDAVVTSSPVRITFSARIANTPANQAGQLRTNTAALNHANAAGAAQPAQNASDGLSIVEPILALTKTITGAPAPPDAGGVVTYTVVINHAAGSGATAYDVVFSDSLPFPLTNGVIVSVAAVGMTPPTAEVAAGVVHVPAVADGAFDLPQGASVTVVFQAVIGAAATPGQAIANVGKVVWSTQPGAAAGERASGDGLLNGGGLNDYALEDDASFTSNGYTLAKALTATSAGHTSGSDVTIGEVITYTLSINLPEGTTPSLRVIDELPAGLGYVGGSAVVDTAGFNGTAPAPTVLPLADGSSGQDVQLDFGVITVAGDNDPGNNTLVVRLAARVLDLPGNTGLPPNPTVLSNVATAQVGSGPVAISAPALATVVEPRIAIAKDIAPVTAAANDVVTVTISITNTGTATAFDVIVNDSLPAGLVFAGGLSHLSGAAPASLQHSGGVVTATWSSLAVDGASTFRFRATLAASVVHNQVVTNTATVTQATTLPGVAAGERDEPDVSDSATVTVSAPNLAIVKDDGLGVVEPGQLVVYTLDLSNTGQSPATGVTITETVPLHTRFVLAASSPGWSCSDDAPAGAVCTRSAGTLPPLGVAAAQFAVRVDLPLAPGVTAIANTVQVRDDGAHGAEITLSDNTGLHATPVVTAALGDLVWWDVNGDGVQDLGEPGIAGVTLVLTGGAGDTLATTATGTNGDYILTGLAAGSYTVTVAAAEFAPGGTLYGWTASPKNVLTGTPETDSDGDPVTHEAAASLSIGESDASTDYGFTIAASYVLSKVAQVDETRPGEPIRFTIQITNTGAAWLTTLPLEDSYDPDYLTYGFGGDFADPETTDHVNDGLLNWTDVTASLGDVAPGGSLSVDVWFTARGDTTLLPGGRTSNQASTPTGLADPDGPGPLPPLLALPSRTGTAGVTILVPTGIVVSGLQAAPQADGVAVRWWTGSETGILGFYVERRSAGGSWQQVTPDLIVAQWPGMNQGAVYDVLDPAPVCEACTYRLQVVGTNGTWFEGPVGMK